MKNEHGVYHVRKKVPKALEQSVAQVAARVPKHVRVYLEPQTSLRTRTLDHAGEASSCEWGTPLRCEHEGRLGLLLALEASQGA
jgi:hypothetical protein